MRALHCICAGIALLAGPAVGLAQDAAPLTGYTIFAGGTAIGREDVTVRTTAEGTTVTTQGQVSAPISTMSRFVEFRYGPDGSPLSFVFDGTQNGTEVLMRTEFRDGAAITATTSAGRTVTSTRPVSPRSVILPSGIFAGFLTLAHRFSTAAPGDSLRVLLLPNAELEARLTAVSTGRMQTGVSLFDVRQYTVELRDAAATLALTVTTDMDGSLVRVSVPAQNLDVLRTDLAGVRTRTDVYANPGDEPVLIPAPGFSLGATLTRPRRAADPPADARDVRHPAVVLLAGLNAPDRDALAPRVPAMAQLAGALADAGFVVVRYDPRGTGQSGGRMESATMSDYANDARTVVRWLSDRDDVDRRRIAIVGHGEGAWMAMLAAEREGRIAALVTLAAPSSTGPEMVLEQQQRQLDELGATDAQRDERVRLQRRIHEAVQTGQGWEDVPPHLRSQADTPWFLSLLEYDPARVIDDVDVPVLVVHGDLDREVPAGHAERLATLARDGDSPSVELVIVRGVNHLLVPAVTGSTGEYVTLQDRTLSRDVAAAVTDFLTRTLPAPPARR